MIQYFSNSCQLVWMMVTNATYPWYILQKAWKLEVRKTAQQVDQVQLAAE